jgi:branched-chain amino acid aminotransferase
MEKGIRVKTSSFTRHHVNVSMCRAKYSGTYANSILANMEATDDGYDEALLLDVDGFVAEGAGENLFVIKDGQIYEPKSPRPWSASRAPPCTRWPRSSATA